MKTLAFATLLVLSLPDSGSAQVILGDRDSLARRVDSVFAQYDRADSPGCAVGVYRDGRIVYARGYGMANLELGVPITPHTTFDIASIDKMFTAAAVVMLVQDGKVSLNDPVKRFFPEMPPALRDITIREVLYHTSGICAVQAISNLERMPKPVDTLAFLRLLVRSTDTNFPPGTIAQYSNTAYALAEQLVYRVSGRPLSAFLQARVFDPLGMSSTRLLDDYREVFPGRTQAYSRRDSRYYIDMHTGYLGGNGGLQTSVEDFAKWDGMWGNPVGATRALVDTLLVQGKLRNGSTIPYGLGFTYNTFRGLRVINKDGGGGGFGTSYQRFPDQHFAIAVFCNDPSADPETFGRQVATIYLGLSPATDPAVAWNDALLAEPKRTVPAEQLQQIDGVWRTNLNQLWRIVVVGDSVVAPTLVPLGNDRFRLDGAEWTFDLSTTPARLQVRTYDSTRTLAAQRLEPPVRRPAADYTGDYRSDEIGTTFTIAADSARQPLETDASLPQLTFSLAGEYLGRLVPFWRDGFVLVDSSIGGVSVEFTRDGRQRVRGLSMQIGDGMWNLRFARIR